MQSETPSVLRRALALAALSIVLTPDPLSAQQCNCSCDALVQEQLPGLDVQAALLNEDGINASLYVGAQLTTPVRHSSRFDAAAGTTFTHVCIQLKKSLAGAEAGVLELSLPDPTNNGLPAVPFYSQPFLIDPVIPALGTRPHQIVPLNASQVVPGSLWVTVAYLDAQGGLGHQGVRPRLSGGAAVWQGATGQWEFYDATGEPAYVGNTPVIRLLELVPAPVTCPGTGVLEGEPGCGVDGTGLFDDTTNGGCNSTPLVLGALGCGDTVCGTAVLTDLSGSLVRDTDWYEVNVNSPQVLRWSVHAGFAPFLAILGPGPPHAPCPPSILATQTGLPFTTTTVEASVVAGTYWLFVAPDLQQPPFACGAEYTATVGCCEVLCPPGAVAEGEACGQDANGGCVSGTGFEPVQCDDTICGELYASGGAVDEDWFELSIPDTTGSGMAFVTLTIDAELPVALELHDDQCQSPFPLIWNAITAGACEQGVLYAGVPAPATFHIRVRPAPGVVDGFPCGTGDRYRLQIDTGSNCACVVNEYCDGGAGCPAGNDNDGSAGVAGCANSAGPGGAALRVSAGPCGSQTRLLGSGLVPGQPGLYFQADQQVNGGQGAPFGNGLRCAGGNVVRLEVRAADADGKSQTTVDLFAAGGVTPGTIRRYQLWYRDPTAGPSGFNLTNGVELF